jgi:hypothetical protein
MEESEHFQSELEIDDVQLIDYKLKVKTFGQNDGAGVEIPR